MREERGEEGGEGGGERGEEVVAHLYNKQW